MSQSAAIKQLDDVGAREPARFLRVTEPAPLSGVRRLLPRWGLAKELVHLAGPVVLGMLTQTAINILDTVMVGRLPVELANPGQAAIGNALPMMWGVGGFLSAIWVGTQAIASRRAGEGNHQMAGRALTNSLLLAVIAGTICSVFFTWITPWLVQALYADPAVVDATTSYLQIRYTGMLAMACTFSFKSFFDGIGQTRIFMSAAVVMNVLNVVLNFLLIYGNELLGVPMMGVRGAALASVLSAFFGLFLLLGFALRPKYLRRYQHLSKGNIDPKIMGDIVRLSLPNGLATVVVMIGFEAFYWVAGQVNARYADAGNPIIGAATHVLVTILLVSLMTAIATGQATGAIVSQSLGAKRPRLGEAYVWEACKLSLYVMTALGLLMLLTPDTLLGLITTDPDVIGVARVPLRVLGLVQGVMACAAILAQVLYSVGLSRFVMYVELFLHLLVMAPVAYLCGLVLDWGLMGVYCGPIAYAVFLAGAMFWKFRRGEWKDSLV